MHGWSTKYKADESHSYQLHLLNRCQTDGSDRHDGCVVEVQRTGRIYPMTPRGYMLPDNSWLEGPDALSVAKQLVEKAHQAVSDGLTESEAVEFAIQTVKHHPCHDQPKR